MPASNNRLKLVPLLMVGAGLLLIFAAVASMVMFNPQQQVAELPTPTSNTTNRIPYPDIKRISLKDAKAAFDMGAAVFVDVRGKEWYDQEHIPGALSMPEEELEARLGELNQTDWIITYCS